MASVSGVGGSGGSKGSEGTGTVEIRGISKTSRGKKKVVKPRFVNDLSLMPMPTIGISGGAIPQYLHQQPLFQQQQNYSKYSQQQQPPPNFQQQHQDPSNSSFQQQEQPMFQQQQYFHNYQYVPSSSHQLPQPQPDHQTAYRPTDLIRLDLNQHQPARAPPSTSGGAIEDEIQFQTMMSPPTQINNTFEGLLSLDNIVGNNDGGSGADQRNYYED